VIRIAIHSASSSVTLALEKIVVASGHQLASESNADLMIVDTQHSKAGSPPSGATLNLVVKADARANDTTSITCPLRPERLQQRLLMLTNTQRLSMAQGWTLDMLSRTLEHEHCTPTALTEKECTLLKHLLQAHPVPLSRDALLEQVWGMASAIDTHTLETHIYRLRGKLDSLTPRPCDIVTLGGAYVLALDEHSR